MSSNAVTPTPDQPKEELAVPVSATPAEPAPTHVNVFVHFFLGLKNKFITVKTVVNTIFVKLFGADASAEFAASVHKLLSSKIGQLAEEAVAAFAGLAIGGDTSGARLAAFEKLAKDAVAAGVGASESIYNLLIELAVQKAKGSLQPATATVPSDVPPNGQHN